MGLPTIVDDGDNAADAMVDMMLGQVGLDREMLRAMPHQTLLLPQPRRDLLFEEMIAWKDKKVDCCPKLLETGFDRCEEQFGELDAEPDGLLKMISLRTNYMHNSNLANMRTLKRGDKALNPLHIHPEDAASRGLEDGDVARIFNENGSVSTAVSYDSDLMPGVVALSHGYGHQQAPALRLANSLPGVNVNRLLPSGSGTFDPLSNMSHMNGVVVMVERDSDFYKMTA